MEKIDIIPSGSIMLDAAMGVGGYPKGRIIEIYGPESSVKLHLLYMLLLKLKRRVAMPHSLMRNML